MSAAARADAEVVWAALADILRLLCGDRLAGLAPDTALAEIRGLDSLRVVEAVALVEERFGVEIDTGDLGRMRVAGDIVRLVVAAAPVLPAGGEPGDRVTAPPSAPPRSGTPAG